MTNPAYEATNSDVEKLIYRIKVDIDKRKSMPPRGDSSSNIERLRVINDTMKSFSTESVEELISALEDANALNKHLDLAIRKAEGCSEALRRRAETAENRIAELESAPNGMMQLSNELAEMKRKCAEMEVACDRNYIDGMKTGWNYCDARNSDGFNKCIEHRRALISAGGSVEGE